jgi:hypothetical protein
MTTMTDMFHEKTKISESSPRKNESGQFSSPSKTGARYYSPSQRSPSIRQGFSPEKQSALRSFLVAKGTTKVRPVKPATFDESRFLKMISPTKAADASSIPESKSKVLIEQVNNDNEKFYPTFT